MNRTASAAILALLLFAPSGARAQSTDPKRPANARFGDPTATARQLQDFFYGVIKTVGKKELVLEKTKFGLDQAIVLTEKTKFIRDGETSSLNQLKVGEQVWIRIKNDKKTGDMVAVVVMSGVVAPTVKKNKG